MEAVHFTIADIINNWLSPLERKIRITFENVLGTTIAPTLEFLQNLRKEDHASTRTIVCESGKYLVSSLLKMIDAFLMGGLPSNLSTTLSTF